MFNCQSVDVLFICNEWGSSKGGLSTFNREFAVNLAKASNFKVHCYVCSSSEEDRQDASKQGVNLITAERLPGSDDPMEWLKKPPPELQHPDVVVGHGRKFGGAAYFISDRAKCKWIHFVHVFCEDLGKHKLEEGATADAIAENEEKNKREIELCGAADLVVAVGSQLQRKYSKLLPDIKIEVITPGMLEKFVIQGPVKFQPAEDLSVFMFGCGSFEDFELKGYDIVGKAVASLGRLFELTFVGSPKYEQRRIEKWFLEETKIARNQLTIRGYCDYEEMKKMFREADVIVMPSRTEGFGLVALEAISAGVPVLVSSECGIAKALKEVKGGKSVVVNSDMPDPEEWARRIRDLSKLNLKERHARAMHLRLQYGKTYSWEKECKKFEQWIHELMQRPCRAASKDSASEYKRLCGCVRNNIKAINENVATIQKLVDKLGTSEDKSQLQIELQQTEQATQKLAKETHSYLKQLPHLFGDLPSDRHQRKLKGKKLEDNFTTALNSFQKVQQIAAEKEKESVSRARSMSAGMPRIPSRMGGEIDEHSSLLAAHDRTGSEIQAQEEVSVEAIEERERAIRQLEADIVDVNGILRDLAATVKEQGDMIDRIGADANISPAVDVKAANDFLDKATQYQKAARRRKCCILILVLVVAATALGLIIYFSVKK